MKATLSCPSNNFVCLLVDFSKIFQCISCCLFNICTNSYHVVRGNDIFSVDDPTVAVKLKVAMRIAYPLT